VDTEVSVINTRALDFVEKAMQIWNGANFKCQRQGVLGGSGIDYARCWGDPCGLATGLTCGATEFCSRPGEDLSIVGTDCPTCGLSGACDCVVGQCLPIPPG